MGTNAFLTQEALEIALLPPNPAKARATQVCIELAIGPVVIPPPPPASPLRGGATGGGSVVAARCCPVPWKKQSRPHLTEMDLALPFHARNVFAPSTLATPADNLVHIIGTYAVPLGFWFQLDFLVLNYFGSGWVPGDGNVIFSLDINTSQNPNSSVQGIPVQFFNPILTPLGSFEKPWKVLPTEFSRLAPRDILRAKVQTNPLAIPPGFPNRFAAAFVGHLEPVN
jgi:hypothetical protein